jgi:RNA polymerase sigma-70 factor (ECF subfamily)
MRARDAALVERIRRGDADGWTELYHRHAPSVYRFALRRLRDEAEAEDVRQDVFLEVVRCLGRFEGRSSLSTWILGIAHHEVSSRYRSHWRHDRLFEPLGSELHACSVGLERQVDARRALKVCAELVARDASPAQRAVFERHWRGGAVADVARALGKSQQAVKTSLSRTRRWLFGRVPALVELLSA